MSVKAKLHFSVPVHVIKVPVLGAKPEEHPSFEVRGITLQDLSHIMQKHGGTMATVYQKYAKGDIKVDQGMADEAISGLIGELPELFAAIVARASRGVLSTEDALELPIATMVDSVVAIGELTFAGEGALEKFLAAATRILDGFATVVLKVSTPIQSGTGT